MSGRRERNDQLLRHAGRHLRPEGHCSASADLDGGGPPAPARGRSPTWTSSAAESVALLAIVLTNARSQVDSGGIWRGSVRSKMVGPVGLEPTT